MSWYLKAFRQYADFGGRARRMEFWMFTLVNTIVSVLLGIPFVLAAFVTREGASALMWLAFVPFALYGLVQLVPSIAVSVRRFHDQDRSGWWYLIIFVPSVGYLIFLIMMALPGSVGPNRFGPDPLRRDDEGDVWPEVA